MDLAWLDDFLALLRFGSFSRAAEARNVTQPAFGRRIRALERWVGAELIDRASHRLGPTAAGSAFQPAAQAAQATLRQGRRSAQQAAQEASSSIAFASTHLLASIFFPGWLSSVEVELGFDMHMNLLVDNMLACERLLRFGDTSLLLCHHSDAAPPDLDPHLFRRLVLGHDRLVPVSAPDGGGRPLHPVPVAAGTRTSLLCYRSESGLGRILRGAGRLDRLEGDLAAGFRSHAALTLARLAIAGRGLAWLPHSAIAEDLDHGRLVLAGDEAWEVDLDIVLIRPVAAQTKAVEALWALVCSRTETGPAASEPGWEEEADSGPRTG